MKLTYGQSDEVFGNEWAREGKVLGGKEYFGKHFKKGDDASILLEGLGRKGRGGGLVRGLSGGGLEEGVGRDEKFMGCGGGYWTPRDRKYCSLNGDSGDRTKNVEAWRKEIRSFDQVAEVISKSPDLRGKGVNIRKGLIEKQPSFPVGDVSIIESAVGLVSNREVPG
jgi:hypothetical protein